MTDREAPEAPERLYVKSFSGYAREWIGIETAENDFQTPYLRLDLHEARVRELEERALAARADSGRKGKAIAAYHALARELLRDRQRLELLMAGEAELNTRDAIDAHAEHCGGYRAIDDAMVDAAREAGEG